jgi:LysM repeat protein
MAKQILIVLMVALIAMGSVAHAAAPTTYVVQPGDTFSRIAAWNGLTMNQLASYNPQVSDPGNLYVGQRLNLVGGNWAKTADTIIANGQKYWGTPYVYGAQRFQDKNFDCSSFVQFLFNQQGIKLGWNTVEQAAQGEWVPFDQIRKGDLLFFEDDAFPNQVGINKAQHVAIYMGDGLVLHTYEVGIGVTISSIRNDAREGNYWYTHYLFAKRVLH